MSEKKRKKIKVTMFLIRRMIVDYDAYFLGRHLMEYFFLTLSASGVGFLLYITQWSCSASQDQCGTCRTRTRDLCPTFAVVLGDLVSVGEVVAGHDPLEAVVVGDHEGRGHLVLPVVVPGNVVWRKKKKEISFLVFRLYLPLDNNQIYKTP